MNHSAPTPPFRPTLDPFADYRSRLQLILERARIGDRERAVMLAAARQIDPDKVRELQDRFPEARRIDFSVENNLFKYLDVPFFLWQKAHAVTLLDLDRPPLLRILDLGCGVGHFGFMASCLGHDVHGIDLPKPLHRAATGLYGLPVSFEGIAPHRPLPVEGTFDLVTSLQTHFNVHDVYGSYWTFQEWAWFFHELGTRLRYPARVFLELNPQRHDGASTRESDRLLPMFEASGAIVDHQRRTVMFSLAEPLELRIPA